VNSVVTAARVWLGRRASQNSFVEGRGRNYQMSICENIKNAMEIK